MEPTNYQRDMKLVRALMLRLESFLRPGVTTVLNGYDHEIAIDGYSSEQINHHLAILAKMGYVDPSGSQPAMGGVALTGITPKGYDFLDQNREELAAGLSPVKATLSRKVFIVHGHDGEPREAVARFLKELDFLPVILHEQTNQGRTIIEKFEANAEVSFAVVLLTPDDRGGTRDGAQQPRARQNVILEWGYFIGRLGRSHVCALKKGDIELPSDILGILWEPFDEHGAWKHKLAKELEDAGFKIDWRKVGRA